MPVNGEGRPLLTGRPGAIMSHQELAKIGHQRARDDSQRRPSAVVTFRYGGSPCRNLELLVHLAFVFFC
jgi:hypothetical protein